MLSAGLRKSLFWLFIAMVASLVGAEAWASTNASGLGGVASNITDNLKSMAKLITAGSYVAGMAFAVGAVMKFKAHKDAPTQVTLSVPIVMLFVGVALIFIPSIFTAGGGTLFKGSGKAGGISGLSSPA